MWVARCIQFRRRGRLQRVLALLLLAFAFGDLFLVDTLATSTLLTLLILPMLYRWFERDSSGGHHTTSAQEDKACKSELVERREEKTAFGLMADPPSATILDL